MANHNDHFREESSPSINPPPSEISQSIEQGDDKNCNSFLTCGDIEDQSHSTLVSNVRSTTMPNTTQADFTVQDVSSIDDNVRHCVNRRLEVIGDVDAPVPPAQAAAAAATANDDMDTKAKKSAMRQMKTSKFIGVAPMSSVAHVADKVDDRRLELIGEGDGPPIPAVQIAAMYEAMDHDFSGKKGSTFMRRVARGETETYDVQNDVISTAVQGAPNIKPSSTTPLPSVTNSHRPASTRWWHDDDDISQRHVGNVDQSAPSIPILEATLVDNVVYDAVPVRNSLLQEIEAQGKHDRMEERSWWRRNRKCVIISLALVGLATMATAIATSTLLGLNRNISGIDQNEDISSTTNSSTLSITSTGGTQTPDVTESTVVDSSVPSSTPLIWKQIGRAIAGNATWDTLRTTALSGDGTTLAVGAPGEWKRYDRPGYVEVYKLNSSMVLSQIGQHMFGFLGSLFGLSTSLSYDGKTIAIGAPGDWTIDATSPGFVRVYRLDDDNPSWIQLGQEIYGEAGDYLGVSVSLSADGNTLAVGAFGNDRNGAGSGQVTVFQLDDSGSAWTQLGNKLNGEAANDESGWSVSLSADGKAVAVGAKGNDKSGNGDKSGHARVYRIDDNESIWYKLGQDIDGYAGDNLGTSVSISSDGNTIAVGGPGGIGENYRAGYVSVHLYDETNLRWNQIGDDINGEGYGGVFGVVVSLSADGATVAVAALAHDDEVIGADAGQVQVFHYEDASSTWIQRGQAIIGEGAFDYSGSSISLAADGKTLAIASQWNDDSGENSGHARVFSIVNE